MCCSPQIANNLPCYPHSVHLSKGLEALLPVWCHAMTLNCSGNLVRSPRCGLRSDSSRSEQLPQGKERTWCFSCSTELRLKTQFKHCRKAGTAGKLCGDEDMKAASVRASSGLYQHVECCSLARHSGACQCPLASYQPHLKSHKPPESSVSGGGIQTRPNHKP